MSRSISILFGLSALALASGARADVQRVRRDLYAEASAWTRPEGASRPANAVPMLRLRALNQPFDSIQLDGYLFGEVSRDLASHEGGGGPTIYADNRAMAGVGMQLRLLRGRAALFAQAGPAFALVGDDRDAQLDVRAGAAGGAETRGCSPAPRRGAALHLASCGDAYASAIYFSRFEHDAVGFARGRAGATWLVTGSFAWTALLETTASVDRIGHPYDNFLEGGLGHRWRLLRPLRVDLLASANAGYVLRGRDVEPLPTDRTYLELRLVAATYTGF